MTELLFGLAFSALLGIIIGSAWAFKPQGTRKDAASWGAQVSFVLGGLYILVFSYTNPVEKFLFLVVWVCVAWVGSYMSFEPAMRLRIAIFR